MGGADEGLGRVGLTGMEMTAVKNLIGGHHRS